MQLLSRARELMALDKRLFELLPTPLNEHCRTLNITGTTLILAADSPVWAARLRFHTAQLVKQLASYPAVDIRAARIRVKPAGSPATSAKPKTTPGLAPQGVIALTQAAQSISDPALKSGLLRLANRLNSR